MLFVELRVLVRYPSQPALLWRAGLGIRTELGEQDLICGLPNMREVAGVCIEEAVALLRGCAKGFRAGDGLGELPIIFSR